MLNQFQCEKLRVEVYPDSGAMGRGAAEAAAKAIQADLAGRPTASVLFASAKSQIDFLRMLQRDSSIDWSRVDAYHVDEYVGIDENHPASFRRFLREHLLNEVKLNAFHGIRGEAADPAAEGARYSALLSAAKPGLAILGIGENGHLAFMDPGVCDFNDPQMMRVVEMDDQCRQQQVHDGAFAKVEDVPRTALSVTIPLLMSIPKLLVVVPGPRKAEAVRSALEGPVTSDCPASVLRRHPNATLYLDADAASLLSPVLEETEAVGAGTEN